MFEIIVFEEFVLLLDSEELLLICETNCWIEFSVSCLYL